jgi:HlyD family secretion protein
MSLATVLKVLLPAVTLAALGLAVRFWPIEVQGTHVETGLVTEEVLGIGVLESAHEIPLSFEISGRVTELAVDEGDTVALGTVLGTLDVTDAHRELDVSVATAAAASADIARAQAEVERGRGAASLASRDRVRSDALFANGDLTGAEHDSAVERDETAQAAVRSLEAALQRARSSRDVAKGGTRIREAQVADGVLVSPIAGFVVKRNVEIGQWVGAGTTAFTVVAADAFEVRAWVDETALGRLNLGQPVRLAFRSDTERAYAGQVARIGREVDRQTHELVVDVQVLELPRNFAVGQRADAWIEVGRREDVARVPRGWCDTTCLVADGAGWRPATVTLGLVGRETVEVVRGLSPDDIVLPPAAASVGRLVRVKEGP